MGGEKFTEITDDGDLPGSPPHGRGKASRPQNFTPARWITPAWAGKSAGERQRPPCPQDHPRMGGEKRQPRTSTRSCQGSPPHGRGKAGNATFKKSPPGITPAWAGKRAKAAPAARWSRDHPRMGGEKSSCGQFALCAVGSPPHGRGKVSGREPLTWRERITPAWAGKRLKRSHRSGIFISGPIPFHSALHRPAGSGGSRAGRDGSPAGQPQNAGPA